MVFSSIEFLFRFAPVFFLLYFLTPAAYRNLTLLLGSLVFYAYGEPAYVFLMLLSIAVNYLISRRIYLLRRDEVKRSWNHQNECKLWLFAAMFYNFGMLFVFKYLGFFFSIIDGIAGHKIMPEVHLELPLGISFYTFQMASFVIDVYRSEYVVNHSAIHFATYVTMFPQLIAGPIVNYSEVKDQLKSRRVNFAEIEWGTIVFTIGFIYKVLLANKISSLWNDVQTVGVMGINTITAWLGSWGFSMQIFFDFFGYSLMAIGLGHIMGFRFPQNFDSPYVSLSATEFWRRWHITLGRWFKNYVYIPLGGNRRGRSRMVFNTFVVWALTGLWHGANWNFIIWGMFFFVLLIIEKFWIKKYLEAKPWLGHIYMLVIIPLSWTIFNITDLHKLGLYLCRMFFIPISGSVTGSAMARFTSLLGQYWWLLLICAVCCTPWPLRLVKRFYKSIVLKIILFALFWLAVYQLAMGADNPFLYFRF